MKALLCLAFLGVQSVEVNAAVVYSQPHDGTASLYQSSVNGTDYDQLTWDMFRVTSSTAVTEVRWRGGYLYGGIYTDGDPVVVSAYANSGYDFVGWTENGLPVSSVSRTLKPQTGNSR